MNHELTFAHHDVDSAKPVVDQLVAVYLEAHEDDGPFYSEDRYRRQLAAHMNVPGWSQVAASLGDEMIGYIYGFPLPRGTRWWEGLQTPVPDDFTHETGRRTFALSELLVRPTWRRRGIAKALHDELLNSRPEERATLLARPDNEPAQATYAKWGWQKVAELCPNWEHAPLFDVLLRPRTAPARNLL
ncbi:GNAT family N-acetyltransferase [Micromonospora sp. NPDC049679]|uniref:GNAT family N-acetyltransferase n=1 Tax=Micromonospora sp. NPDC049679 TaxID=3155920 RepID=UPI0033E7991F